MMSSLAMVCPTPRASAEQFAATAYIWAVQGGVYLFYNPGSGRFRPGRPEQWKAALAAEGIDAETISDPARLKSLQNAHIIAAGGDGTLHVAINHADIHSNTFTIMPVGSGNDFASHFPAFSIQTLAKAIKARKLQAADLIRVNDILAHNVCGTGFEALVAQKAHESKLRWAAMKYIIPVAGHLFTFKPVQASILAGDYRYEGPVFMLSAGNGKRAGGGFKLFPDAQLNDGKLDLLIIRPPSFWQKLLYVWLVNFGMHQNLKVVDHLQVAQADITLETPWIMEADGDVYPASGLKLQVLPGALKLIMP